MKDFEKDMKDDLNAYPPRKPKDMPKLADAPGIDDPKKVEPKEVKNLVTFLHPWMNEILNQLVLMLMFLILVVGALIVLRMQDIG